MLLLPTAPTTYTVADMLADPVVLNGASGATPISSTCSIVQRSPFRPASTARWPAGRRDTHRTCLHRRCAGAARRRAAPRSRRRHGHRPAGCDARSEPCRPGDDGFIEIVVVGAHLTGMPLNHELAGAGGRLVKTCRTAGDYRLFALPNTTPPKPGLMREPGYTGPGAGGRGLGTAGRCFRQVRRRGFRRRSASVR